MKIIRGIAVLVLITTACSWSGDEEIFLRANQCYNRQEYGHALELYQSLNNKGEAVWYNMGNCAYKLQQFVQARSYWKQAEQAASMNQLTDIAYNIAVVDQQLGITSSHESAFNWGARHVAAIPWLFLQIGFVLCWLAWWWVIRMVLYLRRAVALLCLCGMVLSGAALTIKHIQSTQKLAMVIAPNALVYAGPDARYHKIGSVEQMSEVKVEEIRDGWCKIQHTTLMGWMMVDTLALV